MRAARLLLEAIPLIAMALMSGSASGQSAKVTLSLDTNRLAVGQSTLLHVYAQILPALRPTSDRIFSWYVDLVNTNAGVARAAYADLERPSSDRDPRTSSSGVTDGPDRRGIFDTLMNLAGAGRDAPVELFSVPIEALAPGRTTFWVQAGTGVPNLSEDFIVAPAGGGDPLLGGDYSTATVELEVAAEGECRIQAAIVYAPVAGGRNQVAISFTPCAGLNHVVEYRDELGTGSWQALVGAPYNTGLAADTNSVPRRFYRVRAVN